AECAKAIKLSGAEIVTVAVRRVNISDKKKPLLMDYIDPKKITYLPNTAGCFNSEEALRTLRLAREIGGWKLVKLEVLGDKKNLFPVLIKASAGGGGKGMKIVRKEEEFETLFSTAKSEAQKYFGNDEIYIEKFFQDPRHIEVQVLSGKNRTVHLHERDCSVQRRHQKLIEETPSPVLTDQIRKDLFERTVNMVSKIGYEGAGTVEFIYEDGKFYFLEMNTRVQVEHPVTEMVTGIDIIKEQIWIAYTGETALKQSDINPRGHAIECRINAEDASKNFQPSPGTIGMCHQPSGFRTRVDGAIFQGYKVTPFYDSMICKVITHGRNRTEAIQRMNRSLDEFVIEGITTTIPLHKILLNHKKFIESDFNVSWLDNEKVF
ncbi:ATP-grasp domain-containing protein, partial [Candidatus Pelagibacter ubique]|nr:ATP-grasp domain-containing protein [Candidatus Pelagibacter ubique]